MKSGRQKYKLTTYILSCMTEKSVVFFFSKKLKCLVILTLNEKKKHQYYLLGFMSLFFPMFAVIKEHN